LPCGLQEIDAIPLQSANLGENFDGLAGVGSLNLHHPNDEFALRLKRLGRDAGQARWVGCGERIEHGLVLVPGNIEFWLRLWRGRSGRGDVGRRDGCARSLELAFAIAQFDCLGILDDHALEGRRSVVVKMRLQCWVVIGIYRLFSFHIDRSRSGFGGAPNATGSSAKVDAHYTDGASSFSRAFMSMIHAACTADHATDLKEPATDDTCWPHHSAPGLVSA
jgi:hypothetical protein